MAVTIRLARAGTSKLPFYRIVVADKRFKRGGRFIEKIGTWDPRRTELVLKADRANFWVQRGALPSATVGHLLKENAKTTKAAG